MIFLNSILKVTPPTQPSPTGEGEVAKLFPPGETEKGVNADDENQIDSETINC